MISSKYISKISVLLVSAALLLCALGMGFSDKLLPITNNSAYGMEYQNALFDTSEIINIDIIIDETDRREMLDNAIEENYYACDVVINNTTVKNVGIRTKGNTSLSSIASDPDNDRYSFKLEFDHYVDGQTCFGLDKLVLNNNFADITNMKEAVVYDMFKFMDADASLYNYAKISVNGDYWGIYLALEAVEDSFMLRNYGTEKGYLYKPENDMHAKGGFSGGGSDLNYTDDSMDSYSAIWDGAVNDSGEADRKRVIEALKNISNRNDIEKYIDVEQILKYMAVHNFSVNEDSLSGGMAHNYYLYEANGQISILPWDYNLAFGGMNGGSGSSVVNDPIDDSYSSTDLFDFVLENDEYKAQYHEYYRKLTEEYFGGGKFDETYSRIRTQIDDLVKTDPNAMYEYDEYTKAADLLYNTVMLRAESVTGQLDGTIASTSEGQRENPSALTDASDINISDMGRFMGGGRGEKQSKNGEQTEPDSAPNKQTPPDNAPGWQFNPSDLPEQTQSDNSAERQNERNMPPGGNAPQGNGRMMPENGGGNPPNGDGRGNRMPFEGQPENFDTQSDNGREFNRQNDENSAPPEQNGMQNRPEGNNGDNHMRGEEKSVWEHIREYSSAYLSLILLAAAYIFVKLFRRKSF